MREWESERVGERGREREREIGGKTGIGLLASRFDRSSYYLQAVFLSVKQVLLGRTTRAVGRVVTRGEQRRVYTVFEKEWKRRDQSEGERKGVW